MEDGINSSATKKDNYFHMMLLFHYNLSINKILCHQIRIGAKILHTEE